MYGLNDKDHESNSHFITALIKKIHNANLNGDDHITLFGDGTPLRQFMYADDFASVIHQVIKDEIYDSFNVATSENLSINEMAKIALDACNSNHLKIIWDTSKPNGQFRKDVSIELLKQNIFDFNPILLHEGIQKVYKNYI